MEETIFRKPAVAGELKRFVEARLHTDLKSDDRLLARMEQLQREFVGNRSLPTFVVVDPRTGKPQGERFVGASFDPEVFSSFLRRFPGQPQD